MSQFDPDRSIWQYVFKDVNLHICEYTIVLLTMFSKLCIYAFISVTFSGAFSIGCLHFKEMSKTDEQRIQANK